MPINFSPFPVLETARLLLRELNLDDTKALFSLRTSKEINTFIERNNPKNLSETRAFIDTISNIVTTNEGVFWVIQSKQNNELIGTIGLRNFKAENQYAEIGYELHPDYQQVGLMSEAVKEVVNFGFKNLYLSTIEAFTHKNNLSSIALLEKHHFVLQPQKRDKEFEHNRIFKLENKE
jgi:ribosomal-protein-alanine N-acetyltransferase